MADVVQIEDEFYILAKSAMADDRTRVLKQGDTFAVFDRYGDIQPLGMGEQGVYHQGTRFLSRLLLSLGGARPLLLSSNVKENNTLLVVNLTNPDFYVDSRVIPHGTLHISRMKLLWQGACYEELRLLNYGRFPVSVSLAFQFDADYADIFEVRGAKRERKGRCLEPDIGHSSLCLKYLGLDSVMRQTRLEFTTAPEQMSQSEATFHVLLQPNEERVIYVTVLCQVNSSTPPSLSYDNALKKAEKAQLLLKAKDCRIDTSNEQFNEWVNRSFADLHMMITDTPHGIYPYAGIPWFSTAFGRDGIITAIETLWVHPEVARGVLEYLAHTQAKEFNLSQDAEPGKVLHETRKGEMATLGEIPFGSYYGSVDATPLFVMLAGAYFLRTGDRRFIEQIWPNVALALQWIDQHGDVDGDGFVEYLRHSARGLVNQGWKDSWDSVFHADGSLAEGPIALCEVQAYVYGAKKAAAGVALALGETEKAEQLLRQADNLQRQFEEAFWCEKLSTYVLALDGHKRPCEVKTSNAGHCLYTGIASAEHGRRVAETLMSKELFSGWGVRTVGSAEARYNPMSYHNGSVWPHDNAVIAAGLAQYGFTELAHKILTGLFDASIFVELHRLPELFCGFPRGPHEAPTPYPVACSPQSWASGSVFLVLQACLGLSVRSETGQVSFAYPSLPEFLQRIELKDLRVGTATVDLSLQRHAQDVGVNVERRKGDVEIVVVK